MGRGHELEAVTLHPNSNHFRIGSKEYPPEACIRKAPYCCTTFRGELQLALQECLQDLFLTILYLVDWLQAFGKDRDWHGAEEEVRVGVSFSSWYRGDQRDRKEEEERHE
ncbi:hypothetical protein MLD38_018343 [Melastoma candidum]|uniref:Uncharacterized protein n=1 Tax=Melastoma candidum TaxID=119954 RepID=A0ACB9R1S8_9MYRT|nr:hypothetical protein MLD38_018343 [Melastoma candidum]